MNSQVNWLEMEARLRKAVQRLLDPIVIRAQEDRDLLKEFNISLGAHDRKIDRLGEFVFRERHLRKEKEQDVGYLEEILIEREEKRAKLEYDLARSKGVQADAPGEEEGEGEKSELQIDVRDVDKASTPENMMQMAHKPNAKRMLSKTMALPSK